MLSIEIAGHSDYQVVGVQIDTNSYVFRTAYHTTSFLCQLMLWLPDGSVPIVSIAIRQQASLKKERWTKGAWRKEEQTKGIPRKNKGREAQKRRAGKREDAENGMPGLTTVVRRYRQHDKLNLEVISGVSLEVSTGPHFG